LEKAKKQSEIACAERDLHVIEALRKVQVHPSKEVSTSYWIG
jgi:hypothetical protein